MIETRHARRAARVLWMCVVRNPRLAAVLVVAVASAIGASAGFELSPEAHRWLSDFVTILIDTASAAN